MAISNKLLICAIEQLSSINDIAFVPESLEEDVVLLAYVWPDEEDFSHAVAATVHALNLIASHRITPSPLRDNLSGWNSYHYQPKRAQGQAAVLRIIYRTTCTGTVEVMAFGHRFIPSDIYHRIVLGR